MFRPSILARAAFVTLALAAATAGAQSARDGALLVARPQLDDPNFSRTVVLVLRHDENGTIGVVVNRITSLAPAEVFPELEDSVEGYAGVLFRGGPVGPTQLLFLVYGLAAAVIDGPAVVDGVYVGARAEQLPELVALAENDAGLRLYAGHAEWAPGQLAGEIARGDWYVIDGSADLVFTPDPRGLWSRAMALTSELTAGLRD